MILPPGAICTSFSSSANGGFPFGIKRLKKNAVISHPTIDAGKRYKKSTKVPLPSTHTIKVVISPNGDHAPPAFAATTMLTAAGTTNALFSLSIVINTVERISAVVKLSAIGEIKNAKTPVIQKSFL